MPVSEAVRYDGVNAMLLNEFLKEHRKVEKLEATSRQQTQNEALTAGLQKVTAQIEMTKRTAQIANNSSGSSRARPHAGLRVPSGFVG